nr:hypothetical protein [Tanacetum cinerariifolium]
MTTTTTTTTYQQVSLDNALDHLRNESRSANFPEIYMQQFWFTINKKDSTTYRFKIDKKSYKIDIDHKKQEKMYYPRFTKAIIHHFITKDKSILIRNTSPKMKKKLKKLVSPSKKRTLVTVKEEEPKPTKKDKPTKKPDTKGQSFGVPDEPKGKSIDTSKGTGLKPWVPDVSTSDSSKSYESWGNSGDEAYKQGDDERTDSDDESTEIDNLKTSDDEEETEDEFVHTPLNYVSTNDETNDESNDVTEEEYERINEELYGDVNVSLTNAEPNDKDKGDKEMSNNDTEDVEHENVIQESVGNQVKDDAQATQKTEEATTSTADVSKSKTLVALQLRVTDLEKDVKELKDVDNFTKVISTIQSEFPKAVKEYLRSSLDDAMHKVIQKNIADIIKEHYVPAETVERLRQQYASQKKFDQKTTLFETMTKIKSFNKSPKRRALYHALIESILKDEDAIDEGVAKKLKKRKPNDADKDEGPCAGSDRGLKRRKTSKDTEPSKKAKSTETSKGSFICTSKSQPKSTGKSAQAEETVFEAGDTQEPQNQRQDMGNTDDQPNVEATSSMTDSRNLKGLQILILIGMDMQKSCGTRKPLPLIMERGRQVVPVDYFFNNDLGYLRGGSSSKKYTTFTTKTKTAKYDIPGIEDMVPSPTEGAIQQSLYMAQFLTMGSSGLVCQEERWIISNMHQLSRTQQDNDKESLSTLKD